jgi:protoheme IX farnesyltransferase
LFLIIFFWTPPHFWALSLYRTDDYLRASVPMLPVVAGEAETRRQILLYSLVLAPVGMSPWLLGLAGLAYGAAATFGGLVMVALALQLYLAPKPAAEPVAKRLFGISIVYLFLLFAVLIAERALGVQHFGIPFGRVLA